MKKRLVLLVVFLLFVISVFAHGDENRNEDDIDVGMHGFFDSFLPIPLVIGIFILSAIPFLILAVTKKEKEKISRQHIIFWIVIYFISAITLVVVADTINLTINSETKGPVHWHADFEIWKCGKKLDIIDPEGMANRVGSRLFHEHGDGRMHVEGIIKNIEDVDLHNFFKSIGGDLSEISFNIPADHNIIEVSDGELCNGEPAEVQIFAYVVSNPDARQKSGFLVEQLKVNGNYILSPYQDVPPGDCIIVEFDKRKNKTDKICETYRIAVEQGRIMIL